MLRPVKLRYYVRVMQARGFAPRQVLRNTGLDARQLSGPDCLVTLHQCQTVVANMIRLTGDQGVGFDVGDRMQLADFGIIAHAMISSRTLREAIGYWLQYSNLVGMLIRLTLIEEKDGEWSVVFAATEPMGFIYNFCVEEILAAGVRLGTALAGEPLKVREVRLSYPAPLHASLYAKHFRCPVRFNAERSSITVQSPRIDAPLPGNDDELNAVYRQHCSRMLREVAGNDPVTARVGSLLLRRSGAIPDLAEAARELGKSARSLRRHLQQEDTSYQQLVNRFRYDLAREYLKDTTSRRRRSPGCSASATPMRSGARSGPGAGRRSATSGKPAGAGVLDAIARPAAVYPSPFARIRFVVAAWKRYCAASR